MKIALAFLTTTCLSIAAHCAEPVASIESTDLGPVPQDVNSAIAADSSFSAFQTLQCKIKGKTVALSSDSSAKTWFVTTAGACGWGAALGPIWLVQNTASGKASLILSTGGYALSPSKKSHNGMMDVNIVSGTAETSGSAKYIFAGRSYKPTKGGAIHK